MMNTLMQCLNAISIGCTTLSNLTEANPISWAMELQAQMLPVDCIKCFATKHCLLEEDDLGVVEENQLKNIGEIWLRGILRVAVNNSNHYGSRLLIPRKQIMNPRKSRDWNLKFSISEATGLFALHPNKVAFTHQPFAEYCLFKGIEKEVKPDELDNFFEISIVTNQIFGEQTNRILISVGVGIYCMGFTLRCSVPVVQFPSAEGTRWKMATSDSSIGKITWPTSGYPDTWKWASTYAPTRQDLDEFTFVASLHQRACWYWEDTHGSMVHPRTNEWII